MQDSLKISDILHVDMLRLLLIFLACVDATQDKTVRDANKNWLTVGSQTGKVLLQNVPTHYPEWNPPKAGNLLHAGKPAKKDAAQSKHGRSPNLERHGAGPRELPYTPRLRTRRHQRPPGNN